MPDAFYTRDQATAVFAAWGCTEPLPARSKAVIVAFPPTADVRVIRVTLSPHKSTYGKSLYRAEFDPVDLSPAPPTSG